MENHVVNIDSPVQLARDPLLLKDAFTSIIDVSFINSIVNACLRQCIVYQFDCKCLVTARDIYIHHTQAPYLYSTWIMQTSDCAIFIVLIVQCHRLRTWKKKTKPSLITHWEMSNWKDKVSWSFFVGRFEGIWTRSVSQPCNENIYVRVQLRGMGTGHSRQPM